MTWLISVFLARSAFSIRECAVTAFEADESLQVPVIKLLLTEANFTRVKDQDRCSVSRENSLLSLSWARVYLMVFLNTNLTDQAKGDFCLMLEDRTI